MKNKRIAALVLALVLMSSMMTGAMAEDTVDVIMQTGTTQAFTDEAVSETDLTTILQAGLMATSAINQQPWYFVAVTNPEVMAELGGGMSFGGKAPEGMTPPVGMEMPAGAEMPENMPENMHVNMPEGGMPVMPAAPAGGSGSKAAMGDSPAAIIIYMNENTASPDPSFDCGLACQNMVIAASALGYGTKIISSPTMTLNGENHDALCAKLGVDPALKAVAVLLVGKTDADAAASASVRNALEEKVSFVK